MLIPHSITNLELVFFYVITRKLPNVLSTALVMILNDSESSVMNVRYGS